jgi:flagellar biosynthesis/type III secretory pathway chaperone
VNTSWEFITECLRNELQEYGALLGLFEDQQANLLRRDADAVVALAASLEEQVRRAHDVREHREQAVRLFALSISEPASATLRQLISHFPAEVHPLIRALMDEINHLIHRVRRGARHNQVLLARTVEAHEEALRLLRPDSFNTKTYSPKGTLAHSGTPAWQAAG